MTGATFPHREGGHCGSSALRDLLEFRGLSYGTEPLSEGMVFGLSGALAFAFAEHIMPLDNPDIALPIYMNGRSERLESNVCSHLGIELTVRETDDPGEGWDLLRDELDAGNPTMVWANQKDLDYQRVRLDNTRHDIIVTGYDPAAGVAFVADHDFADIQECSLDALARARGALAFPGPTRYVTWIMRFPAQLPPLRAAVAAGLEAAVETMRCPDRLTWSVFDGAITHPYFDGVRGARQLADSYRRWPSEFGDGLRKVLKLLYVLIERAGTGGAFYRAFQAQFFEEAAELLGDEHLRECGRSYRTLAAEYGELARTARSADYEGGLARVDRICELEDAGTTLMEQWLRAEERAAA